MQKSFYFSMILHPGKAPPCGRSKKRLANLILKGYSKMTHSSWLHQLCYCYWIQTYRLTKCILTFVNSANRLMLYKLHAKTTTRK